MLLLIDFWEKMISRRYVKKGNMKKNSRCKLYQIIAIYVLSVLVPSFWINAGYGTSSEPPSEEQYKMNDTAKSNSQDELAKQARERVKTKKKIAKTKKEIVCSAQKSQQYSIIERIDLSGEMFKIALEEYSQREAIEIMSSIKPEHRKLKEVWFNEARKRAGL